MLHASLIVLWPIETTSIILPNVFTDLSHSAEVRTSTPFNVLIVLHVNVWTNDALHSANMALSNAA